MMTQTDIWVVITLVGASYVAYGLLLYNLHKRLITHRDVFGVVKAIQNIITGGIELKTQDKELYIIEDNTHSLETLVQQSAETKDYDSYLDVLTTIIQDKYRNYRFLRLTPTYGDFQSGHVVSITIAKEDYLEEYEYLFRLAISKGLSDHKLNELFYERVVDGKVLELGDVVIVEGTAVSPVTQADDIMANIVFMPRDYYEKHLELKAKEGE